ncbi:hypothetical protein MM239_12630 [Belliella sp. DSM 111904]|uniref:Uncharacterized protein n=1 Tax=Belliella filtrata TaxID=2923435 RepID=A0ABS9V2M3_9BACT|nr:hypothetical protein [Belliella filtrata]MCH7410245.1 hypothetical protein [Belliella filtrata]
MDSKHKLIHLLLFLILASCKPWSSETNNALDLAGENREELEKVLIHYRDINPNPLKLKAAEYLIANMQYQYSKLGPGIDSLNRNYEYVYGVYRENRNSVFRSDSLKNQRSAKIYEEFDLLNMTSDQMIALIESAFETYYQYEWAQFYSFEMFCEYILPYKIGHSQNIDWRKTVRSKFEAMANYSPLMEEENLHEAEWFTVNDANKIKIEAASGGYVHNLAQGVSKDLEITFDIKQTGTQLLEIYYFNGHKDGISIKVAIDDIEYEELIFPSTGAWDKVDKDVPPVRIHKELKKGSHTLKLMAIEKFIYLDYVTTPRNLSLEISNSRLQEGRYYLSNKTGELNIDQSVLKNGYLLRIDSNPTKRSPIEIIESGQNFHQIVLGGENGQFIIDAAATPSSDFVQTYTNHRGNNQTWIFYPMENGGYQIRNKSTNNILAYNEKNNELIQLPLSEMQEKFIWNLEKVEEDTSSSQRDPSNMILRKARQISKVTDEFHWSGTVVSIGSISNDHLLSYAYGTCVEETNFQTMLLRSMGIACAVDFVFNYPERNAGHSWSVIFDAEGNTIQNNCHNPVGAGTWVDVFAKGKVYRNTNTINKESLFINNNGKESIPQEFINPYFIDVTPEYCEVKDIEVAISSELTTLDNRYGYLMVFNNKQWVVTAWGEKTRGGKVKFKNLETRGMYLPAFYNNGRFEAFNTPFYFDSLGNTHPVKVSENKEMNLVLKRKFPNRQVNETHHKLILGGEFQAANSRDFKDAVVLGTIEDDMLDPVFHTFEVDIKGEFKYFRYKGPEGGHCNISELDFFDKEGMPIKGTIIGTEGSFEGSERTREKAFDGDVLTYFDAPDPTGGWVGIASESPKEIGSVRFAARNDGNMVEPKDEYELLYWSGRDWTSLGVQIAATDSLVYSKVPENGLYVLKNHTKGWEERIFTLDDHKQQVWW